jgi:hypothetical protein
MNGFVRQMDRKTQISATDMVYAISAILEAPYSVITEDKGIKDGKDDDDEDESDKENEGDNKTGHSEGFMLEKKKGGK